LEQLWEEKEEFKKINEAYQVLSNFDKRLRYDRFEYLSEKSFKRTPPKIEEILREFARVYYKGNNIFLDIIISPKEAVAGAWKIIEVKRDEICPKCLGQGPFYIFKKPCKCRNRGYENKLRKLEIKIPPNTQAGTMIKLSGQGNVTQNGRRFLPRLNFPGDIFATVIIKRNFWIFWQ